VRCLITGGTGFVGRALTFHMRERGWDVHVLSRNASSNAVQADLAAGPPRLPAERYDAVFHAAGHAHVVPRSDFDQKRFFLTNTEGTRHLLAALDAQGNAPEAFVLISSVAVYGREGGKLLGEDTPRDAADAYGLSKRLAEDLVMHWGQERGVRVGIARLPLVSGAGAPGNLGAMIHAMRVGRYAGIGDGSARRSIVDVHDVARGVEAIAAIGGIFHLTDGYHPTFAEIEAAIARELGRPLPRRIPITMARLGAVLGDAMSRVAGAQFPLTTRTLEKMTATLTFDDSRARQQIGWAPAPALERVREWCQGKREST
jgi:nucleoside-diphosphate-sugar epimerase